MSYEYYTEAGKPWYAVTENKVRLKKDAPEVMRTVVMTDGLGRVLMTAKDGAVWKGNGSIEGWNIINLSKILKLIIYFAIICFLFFYGVSSIIQKEFIFNGRCGFGAFLHIKGVGHFLILFCFLGFVLGFVFRILAVFCYKKDGYIFYKISKKILLLSTVFLFSILIVEIFIGEISW